MEMQTYRLVFFSTPPSKAKLPTFITEGNLRNFILKLNLFSFVFFGFYHVFQTGRTAAKNNIQFQPYWPFFFDNWLRRAKGLWQINGNSC